MIGKTVKITKNTGRSVTRQVEWVDDDGAFWTEVKGGNVLVCEPDGSVSETRARADGTVGDYHVNIGTWARQCEQGCGREATVYAMGPNAGDWGGRYCDECPERLGFTITESLR